MRYYINDVYVTPGFLDDYDKAPGRTRERVDGLIKHISKYNKPPRSFQAHKAVPLNMWIGYVTRSKSHWRILFEFDGFNITFLRLINHEKMDKYLRRKRQDESVH